MIGSKPSGNAKPLSAGAKVATGKSAWATKKLLELSLLLSPPVLLGVAVLLTIASCVGST